MLKDYDMSFFYHLPKANVVVDSLSRLYVGSTTHLEEETKVLEKYVKTYMLRSPTYGFHKRRNSGDKWG